MNIKAYIESGILESYALGMCTPAEVQEVEKMCRLYPEIEAELKLVQASLNTYAQSYKKEPTPGLRDKILDELNRLEKNHGLRETSLIRMPLLYRFSLAASVALFMLSLIVNVIMYGRWKEADEKVIALSTEKSQLAGQMELNRVKLDKMNGQMTLLQDTSMTRILLKGVPKSPESMVALYWNKHSGAVYIDQLHLPAPDEGKQYQLWGIVDGKPVDAGMISMNDESDTMHRMKDFSSAQAFAITLENEGGSAIPTLSEMVVIGTVSL